jgi:hypothetical protein
MAKMKNTQEWINCRLDIVEENINEFEHRKNYPK